MYIPTIKDVLEARQVVYQHLKPTPLFHYSGLSELIGAEVWLKHEDHHPLGAFKVRGGVNFMSRLSEEEKAKGVITASTGNHGQSIAYAGRAYGVRTIVVMPEESNPNKVASMRRLGAEIVFHGKAFDESRIRCAELAQECGYRYVHPANEPLLIAGVATYSLEIMEELPQVDYIFVPVGGGSGAAGACIVARAVNPSVKVIGVQSDGAPAAYHSWKERRIVERPNATFAEGLATATGYELTQEILWKHLDDFVLVSDHEIKEAIVHLIERAHTLAEGAGAAATAGAIKLRDRLRGKRVACVVSGGNITTAQLRDALASTGSRQ
ncbi:MAG: threonine dehydratase [Chloroflexi bacterium]|nr:threonine dehydratase [Chloroflexota bacterium]